ITLDYGESYNFKSLKINTGTKVKVSNGPTSNIAYNASNPTVLPTVIAVYNDFVVDGSIEGGLINLNRSASPKIINVSLELPELLRLGESINTSMIQEIGGTGGRGYRGN